MHFQINDNLGNFCDPPYNVLVKNNILSAAVAVGKGDYIYIQALVTTSESNTERERERERVLYETNLHCNSIEMSLKLHKK